MAKAMIRDGTIIRDMEVSSRDMEASSRDTANNGATRNTGPCQRRS